MESVAYILVLAGALGTLFFAIAFRDPPKIQDDEQAFVVFIDQKFWAVRSELLVFQEFLLGLP